jgi:hypothetical protein
MKNVCFYLNCVIFLLIQVIYFVNLWYLYWIWWNLFLRLRMNSNSILYLEPNWSVQIENQPCFHCLNISFDEFFNKMNEAWNIFHNSEFYKSHIFFKIFLYSKWSQFIPNHFIFDWNRFEMKWFLSFDYLFKYVDQFFERTIFWFESWEYWFLNAILDWFWKPPFQQKDSVSYAISANSAISKYFHQYHCIDLFILWIIGKTSKLISNNLQKTFLFIALIYKRPIRE